MALVPAVAAGELIDHRLKVAALNLARPFAEGELDLDLAVKDAAAGVDGEVE
jgi:hypothetical protein